MEVTLTVDRLLAEALRALATRQGVSVEEAGHQALLAGVQALGSDAAATDVELLGTLRLPLASSRSISMPSPIFMPVPFPVRELIDLPSLDEAGGDAL